MKYLITLIAALAFGAAAFAANDRTTGTIEKIDLESHWLTVRVAPGHTAESVRTLSLTNATVITRAGKKIQPEDLTVGDKVVVEVKPRTAQALSIQVTPNGPQAAPPGKAK